MFNFLNLFFRKSNKVEFQGFDLSKWNYLGFTTITSGTESISCNIHFFSHKDSNRRDFATETQFPYTFKNHPWFLNARLWCIGEINVYHIIQTWPSTYARKYVDETYKLKWNNETRKWVKNTDIVTEDNVIKVQF